MKKEFIEPNLNIIFFETEDVITTSGKPENYSSKSTLDPDFGGDN